MGTDVMEEDKECNGPEYDDFYEEFCPDKHRFKRDATDDFLGGIWKTGEKFLDGNIGGSITTFLKTLAQPVFHYLIHSNNNPVMEKFTTPFIPETSLQGSSNALRMQGAAEEGDRAMVWETMHQNSEAWNPRSSWNHLKDRSQAEKLAFKKFIPTILAVDKTISKRLKDISLVITTLSTSLHDTMIEGMNKGFRSASESLKDLNEDHSDLLKVLSSIFQVLEDDITANMKIVAVSIVLAFIALQSGIGFWQNRSSNVSINEFFSCFPNSCKEIICGIPLESVNVRTEFLIEVVEFWAITLFGFVHDVNNRSFFVLLFILLIFEKFVEEKIIASDILIKTCAVNL